MTRRWLFIFGLALVLRLGWVLTLDDRLTWPDEEDFAAIAHHLVAGDGFVSDSYRANPVLPVYLAGTFGLFGEGYLPARAGQAVFGALTAVLVAAAASRMLGDAVGFLSGLLLAVYLPHIYLSGVFYVECIFATLIALTVHLSLKSLEEGRRVGWSLLAGVAFGAATLTRSVFAVCLPFLCVALIYSAGHRWRRQVAGCVLLVVAAVATIAPWTLRNYHRYGKLIPVSSGFGTKLWQGNNEMAVGNAEDRELFWNNDVWRNRLVALEPDERQAIQDRYAEIDRRVREETVRTGDRYLATDPILTPIALDYMWHHPSRTVSLFLAKLRTFFAPFSETIMTNDDTTARNRLLVALQYVPMLLLAMGGAWLGLRERRSVSVLYAVIGSVSIAYGLLNTCTRFRLPLDPYLIVFASLFVVRGWAWVRTSLGVRAMGVSA